MTSRCLSSQGCSTSSHCRSADAQRILQPSLIFCLESQDSRTQLPRNTLLRRQDVSRGRSQVVAAAAVQHGSTDGDAESVAKSPKAAPAVRAALDPEGAVAKTHFIAETLLPTSSGNFRLRGYRHTVQLSDGSLTLTEPSVIMTGHPEGQRDVVVRVHDACFTSEVLGSLKCDCADQLQLAMDYIQEHPGGVIIYLQQEGRGIGLANKIAAYALQEKGFDTVDANRELGLPDDAREYSSVLNILDDLNIKSVRLMTNNPRKIELLRSLGVDVTERIPCIVKAQKHNLGYLSTKRSRMRHILAPESDLDGSYCIWNHDGEPLQAAIFPKAKLEQNGAPVQLFVDERVGEEKPSAALKDAQRALKRKQKSSTKGQNR